MASVHGDTTRPILLGYDGSGPAKHAIAEAGELFAPAAAVVLHARIVVVGRNGMSGVSRVLGSVTSGVVHHARRPVVVIPDAGER